jgi:hypothetical protein
MRQPLALGLGLRLHLVCTLHGLPVAFALPSAAAVEREVLLELLAVEPTLVAARPGQLLLADKTPTAPSSSASLASWGCGCCGRRARARPSGLAPIGFRPLRQLIESVNQTVKAQLDLERHGGRNPIGVAVRVLQRILALTAAIWHNDKTGQPTLRSLTAYDHCDDAGGGRGEGLTLDSAGWVPCS